MYPKKELIAKTYKEFNSVVKNNNNNKIILKWAKDLNRHFSKSDNQASLVGQWFRIHLTMQGTPV